MSDSRAQFAQTRAMELIGDVRPVARATGYAANGGGSCKNVMPEQPLPIERDDLDLERRGMSPVASG